MGFWILAALAALFIVIILGYVLFAPGTRPAEEADTSDMAVYRDQLTELERDRARGVIGAEEADRAKVEISRRLLEADKAAQSQAGAARAPRGASIIGVALITLVVGGGGAWIYTSLGAPGYPDMPLDVRKEIAAELRENRPTQAEVEAELPAWPGPPADAPEDYVKLVEELRTALARRPDDAQGLALLAQHEAALENYVAAYRAQDRLIMAKGDQATSTDYTDLAELLIIAVNGYVSPEAEGALTRALQLDPKNQVARYYSGLMFAQNNRPDLAFRIWRVLLDTSDGDEPWVTPIRAQILELSALAGVNYTLPPAAADMPALPGPALPGPSAEDMEAAADMTDDERGEMIRGMVDRLSERLASEGGTADEWARLIGALGVLGDTERARKIWTEAQTLFEPYPDELDKIRAAAESAGVVE